MQTIKLNDGVEIPVFGFGTFMIPADGSTRKAVREALELGITHIDTAAAYFNEKEVGQAVKDSRIDREKLFITSKMWLQDYGYENAKKAIDTSLKKLDMDYMDLYLIHQPYGDVTGAWNAMEEAKQQGKIRSVGVSNMTPKIWNNFIHQFATMPSVNQVEFNPFYQQKEIRKILEPLNVRIESWGPLGQGNKDLLTNPVINRIAQNHNKDSGQVILRFEIQEGVIVFPKSTKPERMKSNMNIFDFTLTDDEMNEIRALDKGYGIHNPDNEGVAEYLLSNYDIHKDD